MDTSSRRRLFQPLQQAFHPFIIPLGAQIPAPLPTPGQISQIKGGVSATLLGLDIRLCASVQEELHRLPIPAFSRPVQRRPAGVVLVVDGSTGVEQDTHVSSCAFRCGRVYWPTAI